MSKLIYNFKRKNKRQKNTMERKKGEQGQGYGM